MTTKEKRRRLSEECEKIKCCNECHHEYKGYCSRYSVDGADNEVIDRWYDAFFGHTEPAIKDSGERREFGTGAVRDMSEGKGRMDLLPWAAIMEVSKHCENGAKKYGAHNVDKGLPTSSFADSATRHIAKWIDGWTDEPHLLAAAWNLLWAIQMELKHPELCDVPWKGEDENG